MSKKYNLFSKRDMKNFQHDIENRVKELAEDSIREKKFDILCPKCNKSISVPVGKSHCRYCNAEINLELNMK